MSLPVNITELISGKIIESERIEYKTGWNPGLVNMMVQNGRGLRSGQTLVHHPCLSTFKQIISPAQKSGSDGSSLYQAVG